MPLKRRISSLASLAIGAIAVALVIGALAVAQPQRPSSVGDASPAALPTSTPAASTAPSTPPATLVPATAPIPSAGTTDAACCSPSPTATVDPIAQSDQFWERWLIPIHGELYYDSESVAEQFAIADLVVRGPIVDLYIGEYWTSNPEEDPYPLAYARIDVQEVFKGEPVSRTGGDVEIQLGAAGPDLEAIRAELPGHDNLWFLKGPLGYEGRDFPPQSESEIAPYAYTTTNDYQGVLRNIDGAVEVVGPDRLAEVFGPDHFPLFLDGTSYQSLLALLAELRALSGPLPLTQPSAASP